MEEEKEKINEEKAVVHYSGDLELTPKDKDIWWGHDHLDQVGGFWLLPQFTQPILRVLHHFNPLPTDIILASFPKTSTTWLKSLIFSIVNRSSKHRLLLHHPHELVPILEVQLYNTSSPTLSSSSSSSSATRRIFSTHIPYQLLAKTLDDASPCHMVYVTRNPKDTLVSMWHFFNKWDKAKEEPWPLEVAADNFCRGVIPCGPYYEHVLGYRKLSLERPKQLFFVTYEELMNDPKTHVKNLAEFLGCPFEKDDCFL